MSGDSRSAAQLLELQTLSEQYASNPEFKRQADEAMGVFHIPPHPRGECRGCDTAREKGLIQSA